MDTFCWVISRKAPFAEEFFIHKVFHTAEDRRDDVSFATHIRLALHRAYGTEYVWKIQKLRWCEECAAYKPVKLGRLPKGKCDCCGQTIEKTVHDFHD